MLCDRRGARARAGRRARAYPSALSLQPSALSLHAAPAARARGVRGFTKYGCIYLICCQYD